MPYNHTIWPLSIFCIIKIHQLGSGRTRNLRCSKPVTNQPRHPAFFTKSETIEICNLLPLEEKIEFSLKMGNYSYGSTNSCGVTLNSHRAASPLVRMEEEKERWETPVLPHNWGGTKLNRIVTCMVTGVRLAP
ncbi:hypothetical protein TNCV_1523751 [Trichonephila clavipes]|nr:hypothetical protein TNCV_1523751 [Trichonephila clavipes]